VSRRGKRQILLAEFPELFLELCGGHGSTKGNWTSLHGEKLKRKVAREGRLEAKGD
jgi:hypothetical protein